MYHMTTSSHSGSNATAMQLMTTDKKPTIYPPLWKLRPVTLLLASSEG